MKIQYNFDEQIDRKGTDCIKFDLLRERYGREDLMPLWVADMDFRTPETGNCFQSAENRKRCLSNGFLYQANLTGF